MTGFKIKLAAFFISIVQFLASLGILPYTLTPSATIDFSQTDQEIGTYASGYLYGIATYSVPSEAMVESVDISSISVKPDGGLQHPVGDFSPAADMAKNADYIIVYLQDVYDTWYYCYEQITNLRKLGEYDSLDFVQNDYIPKLREVLNSERLKEYEEKIVLCPFNEPDNAVWFGTQIEDENNENGFYTVFDDTAAKEYYAAYSEVYSVIKEYLPNVKIGGSGFYDYNPDKVENFLTYCKNENCLPDALIYHELYDSSSIFLSKNVAHCRQIMKNIGIALLPILITEYGTMQENGYPVQMLKYISEFEKAQVWGDNAFWRLANNLNDVAADANSPNSNWWLFRKYTDMHGKLANVTIKDNLNCESGFQIGTNEMFTPIGFEAIAALNEDKIDIICGGTDEKARLKIKGLDESKLNNKTVTVTIETVAYKGLSGIVNNTILVKKYEANVVCGKLNINLPKLDDDNIYFVQIAEGKCKKIIDNTANLPLRFEAEHGTLLGDAYTYDSAYATTGEIQGMVGGMEESGDGVTLKVKVPFDSTYNIDIVYGKANDTNYADGRVSGIANLDIDGELQTLTLENTIKSEYTSCLTIEKYLTKGEHNFTFSNNTGTFVLDSILLTPKNEKPEIAVLKDADRSINGISSFLCIAPQDGYYKLTADTEKDNFELLSYGLVSKESNIYLASGLNFLDFDADISNISIVKSDKADDNANVDLTTCTLLENASYTDYLGNITSDGGKAQFEFNAETDGYYYFTFTYSNNEEGGHHPYNVDLIEEYLTVKVGDIKKDIFMRNTYSWETTRTVTKCFRLNAGTHLITLSHTNENPIFSHLNLAPRIYEISINNAILN